MEGLVFWSCCSVSDSTPRYVENKFLFLFLTITPLNVNIIFSVFYLRFVSANEVKGKSSFLAELFTSMLFSIESR